MEVHKFLLPLIPIYNGWYQGMACPFANFDHTYSTTQVTVNYTLVTGDYIYLQDKCKC
jgi:hypothetical protein